MHYKKEGVFMKLEKIKLVLTREEVTSPDGETFPCFDFDVECKGDMSDVTSDELEIILTALSEMLFALEDEKNGTSKDYVVKYVVKKVEAEQ